MRFLLLDSQAVVNNERNSLPTSGLVLWFIFTSLQMGESCQCSMLLRDGEFIGYHSGGPRMRTSGIRGSFLPYQGQLRVSEPGTMGSLPHTRACEFQNTTDFSVAFLSQGSGSGLPPMKVVMRT